ncbi:hypothetical protein UFOVP29_321 [uncultured Caudovirales phage]|uniref:Uncharacterized protein n=1 Tax=uncultured Caudovirales phage TaxID=2100421 RepID=A0A6J5KPR5_9CAUD|nr:hypothetical protein UFOVP29_321 [uncultured Caudovirales phage]
MKIITQYDVGYQFWVPRVVKRHTNMTMMLDGVEWNRMEETLEIVARHKQVQRIDLNVESADTIAVKYYCVTVSQQETDWPRIYDPQEMVFTDEQAALGAARAWRAEHGTEYHGFSGFDDLEDQ